MVVQTRDPQTLYDGLAPDAEGSIPEEDSQSTVPYGVDESVPSDVDGTDEAATESEPEDEATAALREELRAELEQTLKTDLQATFDERLRGMQRTLDQRHAQVTKENQRLRAEADFRENWFKQYLGQAQNGDRQPDARDYYQFKDELNSAVANVEQTEQQRMVAYNDFIGQQGAKIAADLAVASKDEQGNQLFDPEHPDLVRLWEQAKGWSHRFYTMGDAQAAAHADAAFAAMRDLRVKLHDQGVRQSVAITRQKTARETQAVRQKQTERGVQNVSRGGNGAATDDFSKHMEQAARELPDGSKSERYLRAMELNEVANAPRLRR